MHLLAGIFNIIVSWDQSVLFKINRVWSNDFFDAVMPMLREAIIWLPLYLFFTVFVLVNFGKKGIWWMLFFIVTVTLCDQAGGFFKHYFQRLRPCNDPFMIEFIKLRLQGCSSSYSFVSNHAANHFGIAMFIHRSFKQAGTFKTSWLFAWAAVICYAQMYVGIHYPTDILAGMLLGMGIGTATAAIFKKRFGLQLASQ